LTSFRIPALDGLRGVAIISVIVCHVNHRFGGAYATGPVDGPLAMLFGWGWIGVDLFFVLSGFLITGILYDAKGSDGYFRNFYARRTLRIMPLYFGFLLLIVVMNRMHSPAFPWVPLDDLLWLVSYTYNVRAAFTESWIGNFHHFWSLAIEEHFYLIWLLFVCIFSRRLLMKLCLAVAAASFLLRLIVVLSGARPLIGFFFTPCRLDGLLAGALVALAWRDPADWARLRGFAEHLALGAGCLLLGVALGQRRFLPDVQPQQVGHEAAVNGDLVVTLGIAALAVLFAGLTAMAVDSPSGSPLRRVLESKRLQTLG
jgi:peptidoglycan/LPS O-acetylase OafA/YrhL